MQFSGEMNIYRESELSGDFEGEISKKRIRRALADPKPISPCRQLYLLQCTSLIEMILGAEEKMSSLKPHPECENHYH
ncbi:hypothetical protein AAG906_010737 [Vitis piasezkii]